MAIGGGELNPAFRGSLPYGTDAQIQNGPNEVSINIEPSFSLEEGSSRAGRILGTALAPFISSLSSLTIYFGTKGIQQIPTYGTPAAVWGWGAIAFGAITIPSALLFSYHMFRNAPDRTDLRDRSTFASVAECLRTISLVEFAQIQTYYRKNHLFKIDNLKERNLIDEDLATELSNIVQRFNTLKKETLVEQRVINDLHQQFRQAMYVLVAQMGANRFNYSDPKCFGI